MFGQRNFPGWENRVREQLGVTPPADADRWTILRLSRDLLEINDGDPAAVHRWMQKPQPDLDGNVPAERILGMGGLVEVANLVSELVIGHLAGQSAAAMVELDRLNGKEDKHGSR